jgi:hypothetical protein
MNKAHGGQPCTEAKSELPSPKPSLKSDAGQREDTIQQAKTDVGLEAGDALPDALDDWEWELKAIFKEPDPSKPVEVSIPLPFAYTDKPPLPKKPDAKCLVSKFVNADNMDEFIRPIHDTVSWLLMEFDPAFARDGNFPNGEPLSEFVSRFVSLDEKEHGLGEPGSPEAVDHHSQSGTLDAPRSESPLEAGSSHRQAESEQRQAKHREEHDSEPSESSPSLPQTRIRKRSRDRARSPGTPRERRASVSSQSSLSSLEAELLGRPSKRKRPNKIPRRRRPETSSRPRPGRWPSASDSAYSRRW